MSVENMKVYIANLGKYNEGELVGAWFSLPIDEEEVAEKIGLNAKYEEFAIHDYEAPFPIDEYSSIERLNHLYDLLQEIEGTAIYDEIHEILGYWFKDIEELLEHTDDIICYSDCESMEDVAEHYIEETGVLNALPQNLRYYFDYAALGRDMEIEGNYLVTSHGVFEYVS
ncbi:antirestriction protein ArdA [Enterococcus faecalis]|uniref:antirestriction protein ArdA n=1 Tax=Enterococcus faecalis TaxID=1351 RepID=UPI0001F0C73F|nr:antirestriction protein ArdA [Enterococcus faecalis]EFT95175.1 antirestriction protein ArdA [Enterococcus faecalis TX0012]